MREEAASRGESRDVHRSESEGSAAYYAETYDQSVPDWPGEIAFYRETAATCLEEGSPLIEVACGTGRVAIRLAESGVVVVGLGLSPEMLAVARRKKSGAGKRALDRGGYAFV